MQIYFIESNGDIANTNWFFGYTGVNNVLETVENC